MKRSKNRQTEQKTPGERLKRVREILGFSQKKFGEALGLKWYQIRDLESGKVKKISISLAKMLEIHYGINPDWLLTGEGPTFVREKESLYSLSSDEALSAELIEAIKKHPTIEKIVLLLKDMDEGKIQEIFNIVQEKKLLMELLKERYKQTAA